MDPDYLPFHQTPRSRPTCLRQALLTPIAMCSVLRIAFRITPKENTLRAMPPKKTIRAEGLPRFLET